MVLPPKQPPKSSPKPQDPGKDNLSESDDAGSRSDTPMSAQAGEQLLDTINYSVYELPDELDVDRDGSSVVTTSEKGDQDEMEVMISKALLS